MLTKAKEFDISFDEAANIRAKVQQVCDELQIETGWGAQAAVAKPEYDDKQRQELTMGGGDGGAQDDDIC